MARKCKVMKKGPMVGNNVSHANNKTKRRFELAIQWRRLFFVIDGVTRQFRVRISQHACRTIDKIRNTEGDDIALAFLKKAKVI
jgi:large subunit ribosomal protein L28